MILLGVLTKIPLHQAIYGIVHSGLLNLQIDNNLFALAVELVISYFEFPVNSF